MREDVWIGVDVGGTKIDAAVVDGEGRVLRRARVDTVRGSAGVISGVLDLVTRVRGAGDDRVIGVGVGVPGLVEWETGHVRHAVNIGVTDLDLGGELSRMLGVPVRVDNDVNAAALGAAAAESGGGSLGYLGGSLGYLNVGTGLAAGIVLDGRLWRGTSGVVGEIGHVIVDVDGARCPCGQVGCLELRASGSALARLLPPNVDPSRIDQETLARRADVRDAFTTWASSVAEAVRMLVLSTGVERVVIGGGAAASGALLLDAVTAAFRRWESESPFIAGLSLRRRTRVVVGGDVAVIGAALLVRDEDSAALLGPPVAVSAPTP